MHNEILPLQLFVTRSGVCGKSHLTKNVYHSLTKTLCSKQSEKPKVLLLAPTGVAAINIEGITIHTGLGIPIGHHGENVPRLSDKMTSKLRKKLSEVGVIIIGLNCHNKSLWHFAGWTLLGIHQGLLHKQLVEVQ